MLQHAGMNAQMAGNVGTAWSGLLPASPGRAFVVEVSSFQLEDSPTVGPRVAVLLNLFENHLDRHGTMQVYAELKSRLFQNQSPDDVAVINGDDTWVEHLAAQMPGRIVRFGKNSRYDFWTDGARLHCRIHGAEQTLLDRAKLPLPGRHNELNALAAAAAAYHFGAGLDAIRSSLRTAQPVEHRIEFVLKNGGVAYYNDSKSTNMVATMTALDSFERNVILLFGGRPKKESFAPLATRFGRPLQQLIVFGEAIPKVLAEVAADCPVNVEPDLEHALARARRLAAPGDTILLSPGCTSFDQFNNFEERGQVFKSLVRNL